MDAKEAMKRVEEILDSKLLSDQEYRQLLEDLQEELEIRLEGLEEEG